jgi:hypothetical protein
VEFYVDIVCARAFICAYLCTYTRICAHLCVCVCVCARTGTHFCAMKCPLLLASNYCVISEG